MININSSNYDKCSKLYESDFFVYEVNKDGEVKYNKEQQEFSVFRAFFHELYHVVNLFLYPNVKRNNNDDGYNNLDEFDAIMFANTVLEELSNIDPKYANGYRNPNSYGNKLAIKEHFLSGNQEREAEFFDSFSGFNGLRILLETGLIEYARPIFRTFSDNFEKLSNIELINLNRFLNECSNTTINGEYVNKFEQTRGKPFEEAVKLSSQYHDKTR